MAGSINKVILIGNLGRDPEMRHTASGDPVTTFSLATTEKFRNRAGDWDSRTEWHRVVVWGNQAKSVNEYLKKGRQVYVEGSLRTREWKDKEGNIRKMTEVNATRVIFLGRLGEGSGQSSPLSEPPPGDGYDSGEPMGGEEPPIDDDIPF